MPMIEYDPDIHLKTHQAEADKSLLVKFYVKAVHDEAESLAKGVPVFKDREYIDIKAPGTHVARPVTMRDIQRFPEHYRLFKNRTTTDGVVGTLLSEWPQITRSQAEELAFYSIKTVEQLANCSDGNAGKFMNFYSMKEKARLWLETSQNQNAAVELKAELGKRDEMIKALTERLSALENGNSVTPIAQAVQEVVVPRNKGGRPRKNPLPTL